MTNDNIDCAEMEKKAACLERQNNELLQRMEKYEAKEQAEKEEAVKRAQERELYEAIIKMDDEQYKPTEQQKAEIEAQNRAEELEQTVKKILDRMFELKGEELSKNFKKALAEDDDVLYQYFIQRMKMENNPELVNALIKQYDRKTVDEKVEPIEQIVREVTTEEYFCEREKKRQTFRKLVNAKICARLCPKKEEPEQVADEPELTEEVEEQIEVVEEVQEEVVEDEVIEEVQEEIVEDEVIEEVQEEIVEDEVIEEVQEEIVEDEVIEEVQEEVVEDEVVEEVQKEVVEEKSVLLERLDRLEQLLEEMLKDKAAAEVLEEESETVEETKNEKVKCLTFNDFEVFEEESETVEEEPEVPEEESEIVEKEPDMVVRVDLNIRMVE